MKDFIQPGSDESDKAWNLVKALGLAKVFNPDTYQYEIFKRADFRCEYCGLDFLDGINALWQISIDHVRPRVASGKNSPDNLVAACKTCNSIKAAAATETIEEARQLISSRRIALAENLAARAACVRKRFPHHSDDPLGGMSLVETARLLEGQVLGISLAVQSVERLAMAFGKGSA